MTSPPSFPRQQARTQRFSLGAPRSLSVSDDGARVVFLRSPGPEDPTTALWVYDVAARRERLVADPAVLLDAAGGEELPAAERARRERARESAAGITSYATDPAATVAAFALAGRLFVVDLSRDAAAPAELGTAGPVFDPRPDPTGRRVAYASGRALHLVDLDGRDRALVGPDADEAVSWAVAEFVAAEEMDRQRGFWWAPDGARLLVARVDESPVEVWHIADPAHPDRPATPMRYPAAGTSNAEVTLALLDLDGGRVDVTGWDTAAFPYLVNASWPAAGPTLLVQSRDQRRTAVLHVDPATGRARVLRTDTDPVWLEIVPGVPAWSGARLVTAFDVGDTRRLAVDGDPVSPVGLQVRRVVHVDDTSAVVTASGDDPTQVHVWRVPLAGGEAVPLSTEPGVHTAEVGGSTVALTSATLDRHGSRTLVGDHQLASRAATPPLTPSVGLHVVGARRLRVALLMPAGHRDGDRLPVLLDPYGGPGAQRVLAARGAYLTSQWFADQGFAVVVADGRGSPGRGPTWERAVAGDLAGPPLADQVDALAALGAVQPDLDLSRVAIRGWSFGGYLAALAVLRCPDVFHAAVAGAPCTDWRLYDTHYTERYLGVDAGAAAYEASSLLGDAAGLTRPLMLVHGLADDNVVAAHTLRLSCALLAAGRPHQVLPLTGVTHLAAQEEVAENLLLLQVAFLRGALGLDS